MVQTSRMSVGRFNSDSPAFKIYIHSFLNPPDGIYTLKIYEVTVIRKQTFVLEIPVNDDQDGMDAYQKINMKDVGYCVADEQITWDAKEK